MDVERTPDDLRHTAVLYLLDRKGYERAACIVPFEAEDLVSDARALARSELGEPDGQRAAA